jgi:PIN domain nuclease of toxin-antitoxin system
VKLLPDTHVVLWWTHDSGRLSATAAALLSDRRHDVLLSAAVAWEIAIKQALGKLVVRDRLIADLVAEGAGHALPVTVGHATAVAGLPPHHHDPFDRILVAQARIEGAVIVSGDPALQAYDVPVSW